MHRYMLWETDCWEKVSTDFGSAAGIYTLRSLEHSNANAGREYCLVQRILGPDPDGVLYIGCSGEVRMRIGKLRKAVCAAAGEAGYLDPGVHPVGNYYMNEKIRKKFPIRSLCVTIERIPDGGGHYDAEERAFRCYEQRFGEAPPFNQISASGVIRSRNVADVACPKDS